MSTGTDQRRLQEERDLAAARLDARIERDERFAEATPDELAAMRRVNERQVNDAAAKAIGTGCRMDLLTYLRLRREQQQTAQAAKEQQ
jgi:hypothetical protein